VAENQLQLQASYGSSPPCNTMEFGHYFVGVTEWINWSNFKDIPFSINTMVNFKVWLLKISIRVSKLCKFSKIRSLLNALYKMTKERTFEKFHLPPHTAIVHTPPWSNFSNVSTMTIWYGKCSFKLILGISMAHTHSYGVATISRLLKIIGPFCRISSLLSGSFAKETYNSKKSTNRSHPIVAGEDFGETLLMRHKTTHSYMRHDSITYESWLIYIWDMTQLHMRHNRTLERHYLWNITWLIHIWDMTLSHMSHDSFMYETWLNYIWDMTGLWGDIAYET